MSFVICILIAHAEEPMKLLHLYELLYNNGSALDRFNNSFVMALYSWFFFAAIIRGAGRSIIGGGGGGHIFIYSCYAQLISSEIEIKILKSIVFTVCEQEYMNMCPRSPGAPAIIPQKLF